MRNTRMDERIGEAAVRYPFSFVIAGDSGAWPDPTADAIFAQPARQTTEPAPAPVFFANLVPCDRRLATLCPIGLRQARWA